MSRYGYLIAVFIGVLGSSLGQIVQQESSIRDGYTALVPVNIRCVNDRNSGLKCNAEYPTQCKEQWNFPNPCTPINLSQNKTKFVHPLDKTKFLMCDEMGKLYVVQCPQYEVFHEGCGQCVGESAGLTASCERPLTQQVNNPCSREAILANKLFFKFPGNLTKFIHCDIWGKAWERICTPGEVWSQSAVACVSPVLLNPCARRVVKDNRLFSHPCDPYKYLQCSVNDDALEASCETNTAFSEATQRCEPVGTFTGLLENICGNFKFGFRVYTGISSTAQLQLSRPMFQTGGGAVSSPVFGGGVGVQEAPTNKFTQGNSLTAGLMVNEPAPQTKTVGLQIQGQAAQQSGIDTLAQGLGINIQGGNAPQKGIDNKVGLAIGGQQNSLGEILNVWRNNVAMSGISRLNDGNINVKNGGGGFMDNVARINVNNVNTNTGTALGLGSGKPKMSVENVHPSQLREYVYRDTAYSEPCTVDNLANGRTHFRMKGDPHSFLQCDNAGRMYTMPCSTNRKDWFDVYTMTCVDGPVHVDNQVRRSA